MSAIPQFRTAQPAPEGGFEWEDLPSLTGVVLRRHVPQGSYQIASDLVEEANSRLRSAPPSTPVWVETMPSVLDPLTPSGPLADTHIEGLAAREIIEPEVFRVFFGR
jgi:hypothetical protein